MMAAQEAQDMPQGSRINRRIPSRSHHVDSGNRRRFSEFFCLLRILLSCLSRKCRDGGCMVKTRLARFGLTKIWRILTMKPQSLEGAFHWVCAQYNSKESKKLTSFPPPPSSFVGMHQLGGRIEEACFWEQISEGGFPLSFLFKVLA